MIKKYKWKCRILLLKTPNYKDVNYLKAKNIYQKNIKGFHKRIVKISSILRKNHKFEIDLIGFDGFKKDNFKSLDTPEDTSFDKNSAKKKKGPKITVKKYY